MVTVRKADIQLKALPVINRLWAEMRRANVSVYWYVRRVVAVDNTKMRGAECEESAATPQWFTLQQIVVQPPLPKIARSMH
jgi:hypothetical protein